MPSAQDYKFISREKLDEMLDSPGETYEPRGLFICLDKVDGEWVYTAEKRAKNLKQKLKGTELAAEIKVYGCSVRVKRI